MGRGDATLERIGAADCNSKVYGVVEVEQAVGKLRKACRAEDSETTIIAVAELMCAVLVSVHQAEAWRGRLVVFVTDKDNTRVWINKRSSCNYVARAALRVLLRLETRWHFKVVGTGIGTHQNVTMDYLSRAKKDEVRKEMARQNFQEVDFHPTW